ncbi:hypothetical protein [Paenibacillus sp. P46E]|uniref:hypothetical protein n=1 Tax=Paenibacillus sp. P46E TaxID=1349436 RepID=UPI002116EFF1|nr:hypothetical protein [Paenibacillus sp. P46E]
MPPGEPGGTEALRRRWIAAVLAHGQSAAEGWLTLLAALPEAAAPGLALPAPAPGAPAAQRPDAPVTGVPAAQRPDAPVTGVPAAQRPNASDIPALRSWSAGMPLHALAELAVTGRELATVLQKRPGPWLGALLQQLLMAAAAGDIPNDNRLLLLEAKRMDSNEQ